MYIYAAGTLIFLNFATKLQSKRRRVLWLVLAIPKVRENALDALAQVRGSQGRSVGEDHPFDICVLRTGV